jgi:hypothetical protein
MTLNEIVQLQSIIDKRKIAIDTQKILETNYFSKSKSMDIKIGDMHIDHLLRAIKVQKNNKSKTDIETAETIEQLKKTLNKIKRIAGEL